MKLKPILLGLSVIVISANASFFNHDKAYYASHLDDADEKVKDCKKAMAIAQIDQDKEKVMELMKDKECEAAFNALKDHKRKIWEEKRKIREKKEAEEKAKREKKEAEEKAKREKQEAEEKAKADAQYKIDYKTELAHQTKMPYAQFYKIKNLCGLTIGKVSAKCKVYGELKRKRRDQAMADLISQYQGDDLIAYRKKACKEKGLQSAECDLAMEASAKDEQDTIKRLSADKTALKKVFNECSTKVAAFQKKMKWNDANALTQSFKCRTAMAAARNFGVYGLSQPMK